MASAPKRITVDATDWYVEVPDFGNGQVNYTLLKPERWPHPRGWDGAEGLFCYSSLGQDGKAKFEVFYLREVLREDGLWYREAIQRNWPTQAKFAGVLSKPSLLLDLMRTIFDAQYGVENG